MKFQLPQANTSSELVETSKSIFVLDNKIYTCLPYLYQISFLLGNKLPIYCQLRSISPDLSLSPSVACRLKVWVASGSPSGYGRYKHSSDPIHNEGGTNPILWKFYWSVPFGGLLTFCFKLPRYTKFCTERNVQNADQE